MFKNNAKTAFKQLRERNIYIIEVEELVILLNGIIVLGAAIGAVIFLFFTDYYFRVQEHRAELSLTETKSQANNETLIELKEEGDEANLAA